MLDPFNFNFYSSSSLKLIARSGHNQVCLLHMLPTPRRGQTIVGQTQARPVFMPIPTTACSKIFTFPQTLWWRSGGLVILTAALFAGILRRLYSDGYHFGVG